MRIPRQDSGFPRGLFRSSFNIPGSIFDISRKASFDLKNREADIIQGKQTMNRLCALLGLGLFAVMVYSGCSGQSDVVDDNAESLPLKEGNWLLSITQQYQPGDHRNIATVLLRVVHKDGQYTAAIIGNKSALPSPKLKTFEVTGRDVHLVLTSDVYSYDFQGTIQGEEVLGNMDQGELDIEPAMLVKKPFATIGEAIDFAMPKNYLELQQLLAKSGEKEGQNVILEQHFAPFQKYCETNSESPLSVLMSHALVGALPANAKSEKEIEAFANSYIQRAGIWGQRMRMLARYNIGKSLVVSGKYPRLGLKYLKASQAQMDSTRQTRLEQHFAYPIAYAESQLALEDIKAGNSEPGWKKLESLGQQLPFDAVVAYHRAEAARLTNRLDEAIQLNAQIAQWPNMQSNLERNASWQIGEQKAADGLLLEQWYQKHGSEAGLEDFKKKVDRQACEMLASQIGKSVEEPEGNRTSVLELFTGTNCPPCTGADLATGALEQLYPQHLLVLRYHMHTAGLDLLVNPVNGERFQKLLGPDHKGPLSTPSIFLNGEKVPQNVSGMTLADAVPTGKLLKRKVQPWLKENTPLAFDLSGYVNEGQIHITAKLTGAGPQQSDKLRVLLFLAEESVKLEAPNGINIHDMLIRWHFNNGDSLALTNAGEFTYVEQQGLNEIHTFLNEGLEKFAKAMKMETETDTIPIIAGNLRLIAIVHDADTGQILQAAQSPIKVYDTSPMPTTPKLPELPLPKLPAPSLPTPKSPSGPKLTLPAPKEKD